VTPSTRSSPGDVLVTCGGKWVGIVLQLKAAMAAVPALRGGRVLVSSSEEATPAGAFADAAFVVPLIVDPCYIDALEALCVRERVRVVVPLIDLDVERLAPYRERFAAHGTTLVCPTPDLVATCFDKGRFAALAASEDLPVPRRVDPGELDAASYPLFYKLQKGFGSVGSGTCDSVTQARDVLARQPATVFEEVVTADEYSVDAYIARRGRCTVRVPRRRDKVVAGEVVRSQTVDVPRVSWVAARVIDALARRGLRGPLNVQLFDGDPPRIIDVNTRVGSGFVLSNMATHGRLIGSILAEASGADVEGDPDDYVRGMRLYRYYGDVFFADGRDPVAVPAGRETRTNTLAIEP